MKNGWGFCRRRKGWAERAAEGRTRETEMNHSDAQLWERFQKHYTEFAGIGLALDLSRTELNAEYLKRIEPQLEGAFKAMAELEGGAIANPDEKRMVGHYWLRNAALAPTVEIQKQITGTIAEIKHFAHEVHSGARQGERGTFKNLLIIGIGGSALGPQFVAHALGHPGTDRLEPYFFDNTDPDGMDKVLADIGSHLGRTLAIVISKSGGTKETRNGMLEAERAYAAAGLKFAKHAIAITGEGSELDKVAEAGKWIRRFPMWDWVGGRTSVMSAVGTIAAALQGVDVRQFLAGAAAMDAKTRNPSVRENAAMLLALMWHHAGKGKGAKDMVVLPYKDRLVLFSKYLQQLVMESLGKEHDLDGNTVDQGIAVYGNKGSTDQHAYVQQLRDGVHNFFATFIEVRRARDSASLEVEPGFTSGDYLQGFLRGTRKALADKGRESITLSIDEINAFSLGMLVGLFERAVGFYASIVNINAYHQPGVEAGKKAATDFLKQMGAIHTALGEVPAEGATAEALAGKAGIDPEDAWHMLSHLAANGKATAVAAGDSPAGDRFAPAGS